MLSYNWSIDNLIMFFTGLFLAGGIALLLWHLKRNKKEGPANVALYSTIEQIAFALNATSIRFDFSESPTIENTVNYLPEKKENEAIPA